MPGSKRSRLSPPQGGRIASEKSAECIVIQASGRSVRHRRPNIREQLLGATYRPQPVRRVEISKPDGGVRKLDIPTALDRLIQQGILQVLTAVWEPTFSTHSYGFRPGRSAHQAVAQAYIAAGRTWVVDLDLSRRAGIRSGEP